MIWFTLKSKAYGNQFYRHPIKTSSNDHDYPNFLTYLYYSFYYHIEDWQIRYFNTYNKKPICNIRKYNKKYDNYDSTEDEPDDYLIDNNYCENKSNDNNNNSNNNQYNYIIHNPLEESGYQKKTILKEDESSEELIDLSSSTEKEDKSSEKEDNNSKISFNEFWKLFKPSWLSNLMTYLVTEKHLNIYFVNDRLVYGNFIDDDYKNKINQKVTNNNNNNNNDDDDDEDDYYDDDEDNDDYYDDDDDYDDNYDDKGTYDDDTKQNDDDKGNYDDDIQMIDVNNNQFTKKNYMLLINKKSISDNYFVTEKDSLHNQTKYEELISQQIGYHDDYNNYKSLQINFPLSTANNNSNKLNNTQIDLLLNYMYIKNYKQIDLPLDITPNGFKYLWFQRYNLYSYTEYSYKNEYYYSYFIFQKLHQKDDVFNNNSKLKQQYNDKSECDIGATILIQKLNPRVYFNSYSTGAFAQVINLSNSNVVMQFDVATKIICLVHTINQTNNSIYCFHPQLISSDDIKQEYNNSNNNNNNNNDKNNYKNKPDVSDNNSNNKKNTMDIDNDDDDDNKYNLPKNINYPSPIKLGARKCFVKINDKHFVNGTIMNWYSLSVKSLYFITIMYKLNYRLTITKKQFKSNDNFILMKNKSLHAF